MGFFTGLLECHQWHGFWIYWEKERRARRKPQKSHHQFLNILLTQRATQFNVGRGYTKAWISRSKDLWGPSLGLAITTRKGCSPIVRGHIYCSVLIEMNNNNSENEQTRTTLKKHEFSKNNTEWISLKRLHIVWYYLYRAQKQTKVKQFIGIII